MTTLAARRPWRGRWIALLGIVLVGLNLRIVVGAVSPILAAVRVDVALTDQQVGILGTIPVASFAVFGSLAPLLARRFGLERTLMAAMALSALGEIVRSTTSTSAGFLGWTVIVLAGMGMGNVLLPPIVKRYFPDRIGAVTAAYSMAMAVSTTIPALLAVPLAQRFGWRLTLASWSVIAVVAVVPWALVIARSVALRAERAARRRRSRVDLGQGLAGTDVPDGDRGRVARTALAWSLAVLFGINSLNSYAIFAWLPLILSDAGLTAVEGGRGLALFAILALPGSFLVPPLAARMRNPLPLIYAFAACFVVAYLGLILSPGRGTYLWIVFLGIAPSVFPLVITLLNTRTRTSQGAVALSGFVQGIGYTLAALGPLVVGILYGATGTWTGSLGFLLGTVVVLVVAGTVACRPGMLEDVWGRKPLR
ncbi:MFS transporter [Pengzhenrongella phosphoraccumulans]|uniref:MFS transporter n=1 Tax=Pengzhenrongella phosphoraccumulans TaxID=3114394 RepID=UPI003890EE2D